MIAVITDTISRDLENEDYRLLLFIRTNNRTTKRFETIRRHTKGNKIYFKIGVKDKNLIEELCYAIANVFAEYKEPIHIYVGDKCVVR